MARSTVLLALVTLAACNPRRAGPGMGDGGLVVTSDGESTWPPTGNGCEVVTQCCEAMWQFDGSMELACKLAASQHQAGDSCEDLRQSVVTMYGELGNRNLPVACMPPR